MELLLLSPLLLLLRNCLMDDDAMGGEVAIPVDSMRWDRAGRIPDLEMSWRLQKDAAMLTAC